MYPTVSCQKYSWSTAGKGTRLKAVEITTERFAVYQSSDNLEIVQMKFFISLFQKVFGKKTCQIHLVNVENCTYR